MPEEFLAFHPVYRGFFPKLEDFRFSAEYTVHILFSKEDTDSIDFLLESGFNLSSDENTVIDLSSYGFNKKYRRFFLYLDSDRLEEILSLEEPLSQGVLGSVSSSIRNFLAPQEFELLGIKYSPDKPIVMGILNTTPDSFYEGSRIKNIDEALFRAEKMISEGAAIIDVGGQSTRPGSEEISVAEEIERIVPVIKAISGRFDVIISVDTYRREVAEEAVSAGARVINDIYGLRNEKLLEFVVEMGLPAVVMHMKGTPADMQKNPYYDDCVLEISAFFNEVVRRFVESGGRIENLILDPGIGFGKRYEDNLTIISRLSAFKSFGLPILIGHSRKSFIGTALGNVPPEERLTGTVAAGAVAVYNGASILRVHDVKEALEAGKIAAELRSFKLDG
jgi:dihydropteroate synthase